MQQQQAQARANSQHNRTSSLNSSITNQNKNLSSLPIKRQNSRTKMTPQQAAVAMANGMIAANMAAVVNGNQNKAAMQMAMAAAQQQQQQQQQGNSSPMKQSVTASPHPS